MKKPGELHEKTMRNRWDYDKRRRFCSSIHYPISADWEVALFLSPSTLLYVSYQSEKQKRLTNKLATERPITLADEEVAV